MHFSSCLCALLVALVYQVSGMDTVIGLYGETIEVPCNNGAPKPKDLFMTKWKYDDGDLLTQLKDQDASVIATDKYKDRVSMAENSSLLIAAATLKDEKTFTCMVVAGADISEYPVKLLIHKAPTGVEITALATELEIGKPTQLGQCRTSDANPAASITWFKNKKPLVADGKGIIISSNVKVDEVTGLTTTSSTLQYTAEKGDTAALFTCGALNTLSSPVSFTVTYPTERISLHVISKGPLMEGANMTLKCKADGNPPPTSFNFHILGKVVKVENSDSYTVTDVTRESTGEYKCSIIDNAKMEDSKNITINYLDMSLSPSGKVMKSFGEGLTLTLQTHASGDLKVSWTKDNGKLDSSPKFDKLTYSDSGKYEVVVTMGALIKKASFELVVEGVPVIRRVAKRRSEDGQHKVLTCEAEGSPKPTVAWSVNGTSADESPYVNGKITHKLTIVPTVNLTVVCTVSNEHGQDTRTINVSTYSSDEGDTTKLVVGVIVGLLLATVVVGLAYWLYMKKSKQGSWKTGEKEDGSTEESKKLEEKIEEKLEENSQKVEV
ncbi:CD166 antigen homolog isoform X2 [Salmo salar]|uniref:CD166 antigen homolog isoform X2 n=1 Tax=Salmo salar TaxID=8030 RepID=A0A1S3T147_SALSA|nr:CD166 antigen homolog isoform X2 [Salmo salar]